MTENKDKVIVWGWVLMLNTKWRLKEADSNAVMSLRHGGFSKVLSNLLALRGFETVKEANSFLNCDKKFYDPFLINDMKIAAERILTAINNKEKITIYGDYDADGVTSTTLLYSYFSDIGIKVDYYIPDRLNEGYGLNLSRVEKIAEDGTTLVITVDTGISAFSEAALFKEKGIDLIVTDHHNIREGLPDAYAVVNPKHPFSSYPFKELSGVGVAYKLVCAVESLRNKNTTEQELFKEYGDLVTIGTVADVVSLLDENRSLVSRGIELMSIKTRPGVNELLAVAGVSSQKLTSTVIGFTIAPRINACGRVGDVHDAIKLLMADSQAEAHDYAQKLSDNNVNRQNIETKIFEEAVSKIDNNEALRNNPILIVSGENWHIGVIGIVAARLVERYLKPTVVVSFENGLGRASCRSVEGFNIHKALMSCSEYLEKFGGHSMAAGFSVKVENYDMLYSSLNRIAMELPEIPTLKISPEYRLLGKEISLSTAQQIKKLEPFGTDNPTPLFYATTARIDELTPVGKNHLRIVMSCDGFSLRTIMFNGLRDGFIFEVGDVVDFAFTLDINLYKNNENLNIIVRNIRKSHCYNYYEDIYRSFMVGEPITPITLKFRLKPTRDEIGAVYKNLVQHPGQISLEQIFKNVYKTNKKFNFFKVLISIDVLKELKIIDYHREENSDMITYSLNQNTKANLKDSSLLKSLT